MLMWIAKRFFVLMSTPVKRYSTQLKLCLNHSKSQLICICIFVIVQIPVIMAAVSISMNALQVLQSLGIINFLLYFYYYIRFIVFCLLHSDK